MERELEGTLGVGWAEKGWQEKGCGRYGQSIKGGEGGRGGA